MKIFTNLLLLSLLVSFSTTIMAKRINLPENTEAMKLIMSQDFVQDQIAKVQDIAEDSVTLTNISSMEKMIKEDLGLSEEYNSAVKHKFLYENQDYSEVCTFSIRVIYQHTKPLSINKEFSEVTSEASCTKY